jgi:prolyl-tRNA synthetase
LACFCRTISRYLIINLNINDQNCNDVAYSIYNRLKAQNIEVLLDDTEERPGSKFATHDLIGSPWQIIVGPKKASQNLAELKNRRTGEMQEMDWQIAINEVIDDLNVR